MREAGLGDEVEEVEQVTASEAMPNWVGETHFHIRIASAHASKTATTALAPPTHATARVTVR